MELSGVVSRLIFREAIISHLEGRGRFIFADVLPSCRNTAMEAEQGRGREKRKIRREKIREEKESEERRCRCAKR